MARIRAQIWAAQYAEFDVDSGAVAGCYTSLPAGSSATFTWAGGGENALIVGVGDDYSIASILLDGIAYDREWSQAPGSRQVVIGGQRTWHPNRHLMPRDEGLAVLTGTLEWPVLWSGYRWVTQ